MITPQQEAAQMFVAEQAAEVRILDEDAMHQANGPLFEILNLDSLCAVAQKQYKEGNYDGIKKTARIIVDEASKQTDPLMKIAGEYHELRANDELGTMNMAHIDRILEHKELIGDESNLGEIYFRASRFKYKQGDIRAAKKFLKKAKKSQSDPYWTLMIADFDEKLNPVREEITREPFFAWPPGKMLDKLFMEEAGFFGLGGSVKGNTVIANLGYIPGRFNKNSGFVTINSIRGRSDWNAFNISMINNPKYDHLSQEVDLQLFSLYSISTGYESLDFFGLHIGAHHRQKIGKFYVQAGFDKYFDGANGSGQFEYLSDSDSFEQKWLSDLDNEFMQALYDQVNAILPFDSEASYKRNITFIDDAANWVPKIEFGIHNRPISANGALMLNNLGIGYQRFVAPAWDLEIEDHVSGSEELALTETIRNSYSSDNLVIRAEAALQFAKWATLAMMGKHSFSVKEDKQGIPFYNTLLPSFHNKTVLAGELELNTGYVGDSWNGYSKLQVRLGGQLIQDANSNWHPSAYLTLGWVMGEKK